MRARGETLRILRYFASTAVVGSIAGSLLATVALGMRSPPSPATVASREIAFRDDLLQIPDDESLPISASVYSLPSDLISADEAAAFLTAVRRVAPGRTLIVVADRPQIDRLSPPLAPLDLRWVDAGRFQFSPWPRDVMLFGQSASGRVGVVVRPNRQATREDDFHFGETIVEALAKDPDFAKWRPFWTLSPVAFHNGQVLLQEREAWLSIHSVEPLALNVLHLDRVPVASFSSAQGVLRYVDAARTSAAALSRVYGRPPRWVHPMPSLGSDEELSALMNRLGGGAGFDLDSLLTLVFTTSGRQSALVADLAAGARALDELSPRELRAFAARWELGPESGDLTKALLADQLSARGAALQRFLDLVAETLAAQGLEVRRLPLLMLPIAQLRDARGRDGGDFLIGWNNVVFEPAAEGLRAEGFSSGVQRWDLAAQRAFTAAGARLELLPPLRESVLRNGGYRCASNHLRLSAARSPSAAK